MEIRLKHVLKRELKNHNLNINSLSRKCKVPVSVLHSWLQGVLPSGRNLHHVAGLAKFFSLPISVLLFDREESITSTILFNSEFTDGNSRYRLSIERINKEET